ncbi:hypothetical protein HYALB_00009084 [Hymenoscyphus albidus]|uniref:Integral membrane protein n=1 Tax=Hymenoscyphus albidus TaxID=595503 RepID=A0A9N9LJZ7_9HELO|nr:hypothetical protein HYALB_00009084 [Hymenoscyphus albidus]
MQDQNQHQNQPGVPLASPGEQSQGQGTPPSPLLPTPSLPTTPGIAGAPARPRSRGEESLPSNSSDPTAHVSASTPANTPAAIANHNPYFDPNRTFQPSIRIRRLPSLGAITQSNTQANAQIGSGPPSTHVSQGFSGLRRNRSSSAPQRPPVTVGAASTPGLREQRSFIPDIEEEAVSPTTGNVQESVPIEGVVLNSPVASNASPPRVGRRLRRVRTAPFDDSNDYDDNLVDMLDVVDPEVSTLSTLTNLQNSIFVPNLGRYLNRRATYNLTRLPSEAPQSDAAARREDQAADEEKKKTRPNLEGQRTTTGATLNTLNSNVNEAYYAVLPHGVRLSGWTEEEKMEMNDHVRHMLHSRRSKFKRSMKGFGQYVSRPLGFFVTLYAFLITVFGFAWVLFLIGWANVGDKKDYIVNIIDNIMVALFAIMGDGLAPFRAVDTYHMCFIAHYHHLTWRLRKEKALPKLEDHNDLPAVQPEEIEEHQQLEEEPEYSVLTPQQQKKLAHHQKKFSNSHSFYKPHETMTHHAFPLRLLVAIVCLLDCHSFLQIALGTCTWAISYKTRPFALTTVILCVSITVNITAGVLISIGDHRTRKKDVFEKMFRQELTEEAIKKVEKHKEKRINSARGSGMLEGDLVMTTSSDVHNDVITEDVIR